jgi:serine/threonine protein kinase
LTRSCAGDAELRQKVELLLERESNLDSRFLNQDGLAAVAADALPDEENPWIGRRVGVYEIGEQIGAGGMGEVYRAFRADDQYHKHVALKLIRGGQDSALVIKRFKNERQILADLEHPNIARLLDGGTIAGTPYLVMELVEGLPINEYCNEYELSVSARLKLLFRGPIRASAPDHSPRH